MQFLFLRGETQVQFTFTNCYVCKVGDEFAVRMRGPEGVEYERSYRSLKYTGAKMLADSFTKDICQAGKVDATNWSVVPVPAEPVLLKKFYLEWRARGMSPKNAIYQARQLVWAWTSGAW